MANNSKNILETNKYFISETPMPNSYVEEKSTLA